MGAAIVLGMTRPGHYSECLDRARPSHEMMYVSVYLTYSSSDVSTPLR